MSNFSAEIDLSSPDSQAVKIINGLDPRTGSDVGAAGDLNGDGIDDFFISGPTASFIAGSALGITYVVYGSRTGLVDTLDLSTLTSQDGFTILGASQGDQSGFSVAAAGDVNGDGIDDLIVGAPFADRKTALDSGTSYVVFGQQGGISLDFSLKDINGTNGFALSALNSGENSGTSVSSAGDINGDGIDDLLIGASGAMEGNGAAYIVFGQRTGFPAKFELTTLDGTNGFTVRGFTSYGALGTSVASAGDINGDGFSDLIIGAPDRGSSASAFVLFGTTGGFPRTISTSSLNGSNGFQIKDSTRQSLLGSTVAGAGDINGDGIGDLIVGAPGSQSNGKDSGLTYVVFGSRSSFSSTLNVSSIDGSNGFAIMGERAYDYSGFSVATAGDINGDGFADLLIGAPGAETTGYVSGRGGRAYVVFGKGTGFDQVIKLSDLNGENGFKIIAGLAYDNVGFSVASAGDINADGYDDLIVGAPNSRASSSDMSAAGYIIYGHKTGISELYGTDGDDQMIGTSGADQMYGLKGNDTYTVNDSKDVVTELADEGTDTVLASVSYTLTDNVENLTLTGSDRLNGTGNAADNMITGNSGQNELKGLDGNDTLNGGSDSDTMIGGKGNDIYYVDDGGDSIVELADEGIDQVYASESHSLSSNVENITLVGIYGLSAEGNDQDNVIIGNSGSNGLWGLGGDDIIDGGEGEDHMEGGTGDDTYYVDNAGDLVIEYQSGGSDTVHASIHFTLGDNVENLILTGDGYLAGFGNDLDNTITGNDGNNVLDGRAGADTLSGGLGDDYYYVDNIDDTVVEQEGEGRDAVYSDITYTLVAQVEDLVLNGYENTDGTGNDLANVITGNSGNNVLDGGAGDDQLIGGDGNDTYYVDSKGDEITEKKDEGTDTVYASETWELSEHVENLVLTGHANINGSGNDQDNTITGNDGSNALGGGGGADTLIGGAGDDFYFIGESADTIIEELDEGTDTVISAVSHTLADNVENLELIGNLSLRGVGNDQDNKITANSGNNILDGGKGADTMIGGAGDDLYYVDNIGDVVVEEAFGGDDTVVSSVSYTLGYSVNNLTIVGTDNLTLTGNGNDNILTGNVGNNILIGGKGADTMIGGLGDDLYYVDNVKDTIVEDAFGGNDSVIASVSYSLAYSVNNLTLTGTKNLNATGNNNANVLNGNAGNNVLDGDKGADTMTGGAGNDIYIVDHTKDTVTELEGGGIDTVKASVKYALANNVENLVLTGTANIAGTGNAVDNAITGNTGNNALSGLAGNDTIKGGAGNDTITGGTGIDSLYGGAGADTFVFAKGDTGTHTAAADTIYDFSGSAGDRIDLSLIDANSAKSGNQAFTFLGTAAFTKHAGELRYEKSASDTYISGDTNGDGKADFMIHLDDAVTLKADHFLL